MARFVMKVRDKGKKRNIFDKIGEIEEIIYRKLPELKGDRKRMIHMLCHCRRYYEGKLHYGRREVKENLSKVRNLTKVEAILYEILLQNNLNPSTTYRWFLYTRIPDDIKEKLMSERISLNQAMGISMNRKKTKSSKIGMLMIGEIQEIIRRL